MATKKERWKIIKETKSFDPKTGTTIAARIIEKNKAVYMIKDDSPKAILLEKDADLYKLLMSARRSDRQFPYRGYVFRTTYRCNSKCKYCFARSPLPEEDINAQDIARIAKKYKRQIFLLSGGEPTLRKDLPLIIRNIIKNNNIPILITNGIKLADDDYVLELRHAGLKSLCFSFNGFSDDIYEKINGRPYLPVKLKALENIKKAGLKINLGYLVVKGINDKSTDFKKVFDYFLKHQDFIREISFRGAAPLGRYKNHKKLLMSEIVDVISRSTIINKTDIMNEIKFIKYLDIYFHTHILMPCRIDLFIKIRKNKPEPMIRESDLEKIDKSRFKRIILLFYALKFFGISTFARLMIRKTRLFNSQEAFFWSPSILRLSLRLWPDKDTFDLGDLKNCQEGIIRNGHPSPRCYTLITEEFSPKPQKPSLSQQA